MHVRAHTHNTHTDGWTHTYTHACTHTHTNALQVILVCTWSKYFDCILYLAAHIEHLIVPVIGDHSHLLFSS